MKLKKTLFFIPLLFLMLTAHSFALDTDLYVGGSSSAVLPNILIIFDTSGSMGDQVDTGNYYDPAITYPTHPDHQDVVATRVYSKPSSGNWFGPLTIFKNSIAEVECSTARSVLATKGLYTGRTNATCTKTNRTLATGNYLNFFLAFDGLVGMARKTDIAKNVIKDFLDTVSDVRVGLMRYGSTKQDGSWDGDEGGSIVYEIQDLKDNNRNAIKAVVDSLPASGYTPLAETLYEAGCYFVGQESYFNYKGGVKVKYTSPMQYYCQRNYIILMTDGISTQDRNSILATIGDQDGDLREPPGAANDPGFDSNGSDYLDDVVKYLYETDLSGFEGKQNIVTYTIGFELDSSDPDNAPLAKDLLRRTADHGHGKFYTTSGTAGLADAFSTILGEIFAKTTSYVAPIVPVSRFERTTAGDKIYLALFKPSLDGMWKGNIKKYGVAQTTNIWTRTNVGDILDISGRKALDSDGKFYPSSKSYWSSVADGGEVELGGVGEILLRRSGARKIYTFLPGDPGDESDDSNTSTNLTNSWNAFTKDNSRLTTTLLGVSTTNEKNKLIDYVHGLDAYDDNINTITDEKRSWILGSFLHSRPFIIHYGPDPSDPTVIYAGANDGMLHAFDDETGEELWGFIPPCLLGRLNELHTSTPGVFVDGSPKAYVTYDTSGNVTKAILLFGLRRGGNYYYALDVTNPSVPKYLWRVYKDRRQGLSTYYQELGQTWSAPMIGKVAYGTGEKWVAIFGGGYDEGQDQDNPPSDDIGRGIYIADVETGDCIWYHSYRGGDTNMTYSIPSDITKLDIDGDGRIDRLYVGDMNARIWRFDIGDVNKNGNSDPAEWTGRIIFKSNAGLSEKRKIFYPPDVTLENGYEMLFFGTGDREAPKSNKDMDRIYGFKDKNASTIKGESDLVDVTDDLLQTGTQSQKQAVQDALDAKYGWFIKLDKQDGEKCLAPAVVFYGTAYFTAFSPTVGSVDDPCFVGEGVAWVYAVDYLNGNAVFNFDLTNDTGETVLAKSDRLIKVGSAIPSGVVITVIGNTAVGYIGVGGGIFRPQLKKTKVFFPINWKIVF
jgi:type IV pilus assembly protein PilY1